VSPAAAIEVQGLVKRFGSLRAVDGFDLRVEAGEVHGFLGPNGAGKSTTMRVLLGLYRRTAGQVRVLGLDPGEHSAQVTRHTSYVPGDVALWGDLTGQEVLDALAGLRGAYDLAAERRLVDAFALNPRKKVRSYSKGNRQKVVLVAAFAARTELLVLDEPTSGLDPLLEELFRRCVRDASADGRTVLLSSHRLDEVEQLCGSVTIIKDGRQVDSGRIADMRHLAASTIAATVAQDELPTVLDGLRLLGLKVHHADGGELRLSVPRDQVPPTLGLLAAADARDIVCAPATLEDLFLRHYEVAAR
jgi:ABC-2 type transport system ATP-binding protein